MALTQEQLDRVDNLCIEIRDLCGRIIQRKREINETSIEVLVWARDKLRNVNNAFRW
jgi:hypothetical protein